MMGIEWSARTALLLSTLLVLQASSCLGFLQSSSSTRPFPVVQSTKDDDQEDTISRTFGGSPLRDLRVTIVGAGPAGLLLAHRLLQQGAAQVSLYESRPDPRVVSKAGFAYALGLGIRGRTALRSVDETLWRAVQAKGDECDRFRFHVGPFQVKLRDSPPKPKNPLPPNQSELEPSLLLFQADLCISLMEELERRYADQPERFQLNFDSRIQDCDLENQRILLVGAPNQNNTNETILVGPYDLLVGCDGVNSVVRTACVQSSPPQTFQVEKRTLPGEFKVARLPTRPPKMDPNAVALILPKVGTTTAFLEPTVNGSCCILFAGRGGGDGDSILSLSDDDDPKTVAALAQTILQSFPLLEGIDLEDVAHQLLAQKPGSASSVRCNVYHWDSSVALVGDAAHATGGVSGQGVNSALLDAAVLGDCLVEHYDPSDQRSSLQAALLAYSQRQVPEGQALYDLSFGPKPKAGPKRVLYALQGLRDALFRGRFGIGRPPLQTLLTTSMESFSSIRRRLDYYYDEPFPDPAAFDAMIELASDAITPAAHDQLNPVARQ